MQLKTQILKITETKKDAEYIEAAAKIIQDGGIVAFPTETVYGLGGDALCPSASKKIYAAKGRPSDNPLIVHIAEIDAIRKITRDIPKEAFEIANAFWPGPLTMILKKADIVPKETTGGLETVAVRMPSNPVAAALIKASGGYIAAPSANSSGKPSPTKASHVYDDLNGKIPMILDGGECDVGLESTIIDLSERPFKVLRPGYITRDMLAKVVGPVALDPGIKEGSKEAPKAPGMKYRHYAPKAELTIVRGERERIAELAKECTGKKLGILCNEEDAAYFEDKADIVISLGRREDGEAAAHRLFAALREFDARSAEYIYSQDFSQSRIGEAVMNRLIKAAGYRII